MNPTTGDDRHARDGGPDPYRPRLWPGPAFPYVVGESKRMQDIYAVMTKVAEGDANICIEGEHGTGKELIAKTLHTVGPRRDRPFVTLDCAAIPEGSLDRQLSGHVREGVTLFLAGIGELTPHLQARLLQVIRTGPRVRVIAATNRDLRRAIHDGHFHGDLYHCIAVVHVELPPLRDRAEDIPLLVAHFLRRKAAQHQKTIRGLTSCAIESLVANPWPGNVRQLENWIERAVMLAGADLVDLEHFPSVVRETTAPPLPTTPRRLRLREVEKLYILETLAETRWNRAAAARLLGISVRGLQYKLKRYLVEGESIIGVRPGVERG
jgi:DNA-binding NtrC family response regulator